MSDAFKKAEEFKAAVEAKIQALIQDFADGKLSREQFHVLYERYNARLRIADHAVLSGNPDVVQNVAGGPPTIAVRDAHMGRALGLMIYHNNTETVLETLGDFDLPMAWITPTLEDMTLQMLARKLIDRKTEKISKDRWLAFMAGNYTTVVTLFLHEPSALQLRELERLQHDFEQANFNKLQATKINPKEMAYPFLVFVKKRFGK